MKSFVTHEYEAETNDLHKDVKNVAISTATNIKNVGTSGSMINVSSMQWENAAYQTTHQVLTSKNTGMLVEQRSNFCHST